jgi:hypothetical protein
MFRRVRRPANPTPDARLAALAWCLDELDDHIARVRTYLREEKYHQAEMILAELPREIRLMKATATSAPGEVEIYWKDPSVVEP